MNSDSNNNNNKNSENYFESNYSEIQNVYDHFFEDEESAV